MSHTVVGIFDNAINSEKAVDRLLSNGFSRDRVDIADHSSHEGYTDADRKNHDEGIGGFFSSLFGDSDDSRHHTDAARSGIVVTVHTKSRDEAEKAADILDDFGTVDVGERAGVQRDTTATTGTATDDKTIEVVEENMQVGKRETETGGVRVRSRIVERPVEEKVRLRTEHVNVERKPVDRPATEADMANLKDGETIEMTEHSESVVANKEARVTEEIHLDKDVEEREEVVKDTVRSTEVDVDETAADRRDATTADRDRTTDRDRKI